MKLLPTKEDEESLNTGTADVNQYFCNRFTFYHSYLLVLYIYIYDSHTERESGWIIFAVAKVVDVKVFLLNAKHTIFRWLSRIRVFNKARFTT